MIGGVTYYTRPVIFYSNWNWAQNGAEKSSKNGSKWMKILSFTSSMNWKGKNWALAKIEREMHVENNGFVFLGSIILTFRHSSSKSYELNRWYYLLISIEFRFAFRQRVSHSHTVSFFSALLQFIQCSLESIMGIFLFLFFILSHWDCE